MNSMRCKKSSTPIGIVRHPKFLQSVVLASAIFLSNFGAGGNAVGQEAKDIRSSSSPLVLKTRGSFFVGGERVEQTQAELGNFGPADQITVNQMYVEFMAPQGIEKIPVVMVHGANLSGKTYDTTPDGRMGWYEYFVRQGHPVYVPDQVGRARSGFNQAVFNNVRAGVAPSANQYFMLRLADKFGVWTNFRFGATPGVAFSDTQFPVEAVDQLSKQSVPDLNQYTPAPNATFKALSDLASQLRGTVLMGHSQSGRFPLEAALTNAIGIRGMILVEPGSCPAYTDEQIANLAKLPILIVYGDHLDSPTQFPGPSWQERYNGCQTFITRVKAASGNAQMLYPPALGIHGNSHMIMQDRNNLQIADLILKWIETNVNN
jgi:pimeloyl-ACP methyl ester carboxylesterase